MVGVARVQRQRPYVRTGLGMEFAVGQALAVGRKGPRDHRVLTIQDLLWLSGAVAAGPPDPVIPARPIEGHVPPVWGPDR